MQAGGLQHFDAIEHIERVLSTPFKRLFTTARRHARCPDPGMECEVSRAGMSVCRRRYARIPGARYPGLRLSLSSPVCHPQFVIPSLSSSVCHSTPPSATSRLRAPPSPGNPGNARKRSARSGEIAESAGRRSYWAAGCEDGKVPSRWLGTIPASLATGSRFSR